MASAEADVAARLIERLLADPAFRARFRRDPASACREAGLEGLAEEMSLGAGKAMYTLDVRESKSSLAGVMMAAAMEGVGIYQFTENVLPHLEEVPGHVADVLSRVDLPAIRLPNFGGGGGGGGGAAAAAVPPPSGDAATDALPSGDAAGSAVAAAPPAPPPPVAAAVPPEAAGAKAAAAEAAKEAAAKKEAAAPPEAASPAQEAAKKIAEESSPEAEKQAAVDKAAADLDAQGTNLPSASELPTEAPAGTDAPAGAPPADAAAAAPPAADPAAAAAPPAAPPPTASDLPTEPPAAADAAATPGAGPPPPSASSLPTEAPSGADLTDSAPDGKLAEAVTAAPPEARYVPDPAMYGADGTGGAPSPEAAAVLKNDNITLDADGKADLSSGKMDPRTAAIMLELAQTHKITITSTFSDHPVNTAGGSVSNHTLGRGFDIGAIDGQPVNSGSPVAREVAAALSQLDPAIRPTEVGTPFPISEPGYFTDADHQDHIHVAFDDPIAKDYKTPAGILSGEPAAAPPEAAAAAAPAPVAAPAVAAVPAPAAPAPVAAAAAAPEPAPKPKAGSQAFLKAVTAEAAAKERAARGDSQAFLKAVEPPKPAAAAAAQPGAPVAAAASLADFSGGPATYPGDDAPREQIAAWMAAEAQKRGLPPQLPVMASLVESGMKNLNFGDADSVGFFQMRVGIWNQGEYKGYPDNPELQVKWFLDNAEAVKKQRLAAGKSIDDPNQFGEWIADVERPAEQFRGRYQLKLDEANGLLKSAAPAPAVAEQAVAAVAPAGGGGSSLGAAALQVAQSQKGVREVGGANVGPQVDQYLAAAKVAPGNPWCASFVTWSLEKAGHKMPGGGWAAVSTWVQNAKQGSNGLKIVSAEDARPGDIVAYDWGGGEDFGSDGHIGFLESTVKGGQFTALEGNNNDAVSQVPRHLGGANIVFIRADGNGSAGAAVPVSAPAAVEQAAPSGGGHVDPLQFGAEGGGGTPDPEALALLSNKNVVLDDTGVADIKAGRIDPRVIAVITKLSHEHKITISCMCSDHSKFTAGGSVSNHHFGRGADIAAIDGQPVGPGNPVAREVASELSTLDPSMRPNEIGSPWAIAGPGYFTDAAHQNHLHIGFKEAVPADFQAPADVSATPGAAPVAAAAAVPGAPAAAPPAAAVEAPKPKTGSQAFMRAITAEEAAADKAKRGDSMAFLKAVEPPKAAAAAAPAPAAGAAPAPAVAEAAAAAFSGGPTDYPGDDAPREQIAAWMAAQAQKRGLPAELPIMASLVESGMKNLHYGDADSVGFYQMRVSIWSRDYPGYQDKPELQVKWFLDQAEAVKKQRLAAGKPIDDPNQYGDWIADVERPAEQYRGRYQLKLDEAQGLLKNAQPAAAPAAVAAAVPAADVAAGASAVADAKLPAEVAQPVADAIAAGAVPGPAALKAVEEASKYIGTDYKFGGSTPQTGFDCSGLMQWAYAQAGVQTPRVTYDQIDAANAVKVPDMADLHPGDMVFFSNAGDVHHVGMYLGDHKFLHAPHTGDVVKVSSLDEPYYKQQFAGGRRFDQGAPVAAAPGVAAAADPAAASAAAPAAAPPAAAPVAAAASVPPAAPVPDPTDVAKAQAGVARDAAEVRRNDSQLFLAVTAQEARKQKHASVMFLKAVQPDQVKPAAAAAAVPPPAAPPPPAAEPPPAVEPAPVAPAPAAPEAAAPPELSASLDLASAATDYPGDDASQAELAKWLAGQAQKAGLPPELPVMASLVESGVKNLNFGDADSVGFFQMRVGIWNKGDYAGYPDKPELQAKWFIDQALAVKRKAIAAGDPSFGKDPAKFGEWIADVERPAEQFRGRYQLRLGEARKLLEP